MTATQLTSGHYQDESSGKNEIYWLGMTKDIEQMINNCNTCQCFQATQYDLPLGKQPTPNCLWQIVVFDLFDFDRGQHMVVTNMYSKMCFVWKNAFCWGNISSYYQKDEEIFAEHGVPDILRSDNGPQYASAAFIEFAEEWGFQHTTSSPHYPGLNGFAESMVKIIKTGFTKAKYSGKDPQLTLLALHSTLVDSHLPSPAQLLFQWKLKTRLLTQPSNADPHADECHDHLENKSDHAKMTHH